MSQKRHLLNYIVAYLLWIISTGLGILILNMGREAVLLGIVVSTSQPNATQTEKFYASLQATAISTWSILLIGLLLLILMVGIENLYRLGVASNLFVQRFFMVTGIEFGVLFIAHSIYYALLQSFRPVTWTFFAFPAAEIFLAALFLGLARWQKKKAALTRL